MVQLLKYLLVNGLAVFVAAYVLPGVTVSSFWVALVVAIVFGLLNAVVKPILTILTLPITIFTLGLFLLVINVAVVFMASALVDGFAVDGWLWALLFSFIVSIVSAFLGALSGTKR